VKEPFIWDNYSDQPYPIKDKKYKNSLRVKNLFNYLKNFITTLLLLPFIIIVMPFTKAKKLPNKNFYGMGVDISKGAIQKELINELGIKNLLIRVPLWHIDRVDEYIEFAKSFGSDKNILINILQDREHIEDLKLLEKDINIIFNKFQNITNEFQVANAINRTKWGFFSVDEYLKYYETIQILRDTCYPNIKLIGSSVIDFEPHITIRTLYNLFKVRYDIFSTLLYVDRRGAPTNKQMLIFDTKRKIDLIYTMVKLSPKSNNSIYITEVNWPLSNTAPYAPTSETECVNQKSYTKYMLEFYNIAKESNKIDRVYWHQLIAPGYGLVDNRDGIKKREAFYEYKRMINENN